MFGLAIAALLLVIALAGIALRKTYYYLPPKELKRQAEQGDKLARTLYRAVSYGPSLRVLLWLLVGLCSAGGIVLLARSAPWWIGFIATALLLWLAFSWLPNTRVTAVGARLAVWATPAIAVLLNYLHPVLSRLGEPLHRHYRSVDHTGLYDTADLVELVEKQKMQDDSRIPANQLEALAKVLAAQHYKVGDVLTSRDQVKTVSDNDTVGLVLLDELHAAGQSSFPVVQGKTDKVIGALYLHDLNLKTEGKVRDYMHHNVRYLHEEDSLSQALQAFFKTKQQLFVVVNSFEEYIGIVTLEHIVKQLTGEVKVDDFDQHDDLAAVANKHAHDDDEPGTGQRLVSVDTREPSQEQAEEADSMSSVEDVAPQSEEVSVLEPEDEIADPEPESEIVTEKSEEPESESEAEKNVQHESETGALEMQDEPKDSENEPSGVVDPDNLAALDLPDEEENKELGEGSHVSFQKAKTEKSKPGAKKSEE